MGKGQHGDEHEHGHDEPGQDWEDGTLDFCDQPLACVLGCGAPCISFADNMTKTGIFSNYYLALVVYGVPWFGLVMLYMLVFPAAAGFEYGADGAPVSKSFVQMYPAVAETMLTFGLILFTVMICVGGYFRGLLRHKLGIKGLPCEDYCCHTCCCCCSIAQESRAVKNWLADEELNKDIENRLHKTPLLAKSATSDETTPAEPAAEAAADASA